uniref:Transcriptional regulator SLK2 n=1 Tax=Oryza barthii TaxID=65489 RepID=A0A0D3GC82_9ORYZ
MAVNVGPAHRLQPVATVPGAANLFNRFARRRGRRLQAQEEEEKKRKRREKKNSQQKRKKNRSCKVLQSDDWDRTLVTSMSGAPRSNLGLVPRDMHGSIPISTTNSSGPSIGVSSLVTDANSSLSGGAQLQPSTSMNADSFMRLPASPMSFSSNNISGSSVIDGPIVQQSPPQEQMQKRRSSSVTSQPVIDAVGALHAQKKSRVDIRQDDILQHNLIQQLLQGQSSLHLQGQQNPQIQALIHQHKLAQIQQQQQHQMLQPFSQIQQSQVGIPRQPQLRPPLAQPGMQLAGPVRTPVENGLCSRRLKQYLYHKRHRPENNPITYWRKLIDEYFAPRARERWCVSSYEKRGNPSGAVPHTAPDSWRCDICNTHVGKGYEATYEILPRLCQIRFDHGVIDEYLFLDMANEFRLPNGLMLLEHTKVVQKSIYEHMHVIHEGQLRIIFTPELKIMSWEFCSRRHDEYITRRFLSPQVAHLLQVAQKYQTVATESGPAGVSNSDAQNICNMFVTASRQLAKNIDHHTLNEHGLSKRYVRCLQISEVVNHMKDLIEFSHKNKLGPIEGLKSYPKQTAAKLPVQNMHEPKQLMAAAGLPNDQTNLKAMGVKAEMNTHANETHGIGPIGNGPTAMHNGIQLEASRSFRGPNQVHLAQFQHPASFQQPMPQQSSLQGLGVSPQYQQHVLHQLLQEAKNTNNRVLAQQQQQQQQLQHAPANSGLASGGTAITGSAASGDHMNNNGAVKGGTPMVTTGPSSVINNTASILPSRSNSFKSVSSNPQVAPAAGGGIGSGGHAATPKADALHELDDLDNLGNLISTELEESGLFLGDQAGGGYSWNM